jgi:battenin
MVESFSKYFSAFYAVGLINNLGYVVIGTGAQALALHYGQQNLMPLFQLMLVSFNIVALVGNMRYLINIRYSVRVTAALIGMTFSFSLMAFCSAQTQIWGFILALFAALLMGLCQSWGECIILGFNKAFPPNTVVGFSSGTGSAGILGTSIWIGLTAAGVPMWGIYAILAPGVIAYYFSFKWLNTRATQLKEHEVPLTSNDPLQLGSRPSDELVTSQVNATGNAVFSRKQLTTAFRQVWYWALCLGSVYYLEYTIITGFADRATLKQGGSDFIGAHAYAILLFCYQIGVTLSRSSLKLFHIRRVWIVSALQAINFAVWWVEAMSPFMTYYGEFVLMVWVGCLGGLSYVNVAYLILNSETLDKQYKETGVNISLCFNNIGIILACLTCLLLDNTLMKY